MITGKAISRMKTKLLERIVANETQSVAIRKEANKRRKINGSRMLGIHMEYPLYTISKK